MLRNFKLVNKLGQSYELSEIDHKSGLIYDVSNLGYKDSVEYQTIGNRQVILSDRKEQQEISGVVHFPNYLTLDKPHKEYQEFVKFLQHKPLVLYYQPFGLTTWYRRNGTVTEATYNEAKPLQAEITFTCTTLFYKRVIETYYPSLEDNGKIYNYQYNYNYRNFRDNEIEIELDTTIDTPTKLKFYGYLHNPVWTYYLNEVEVCNGQVNCTVEEDQYIQIDTTELPFSIGLYDDSNNFIEDLYPSSDFSTERFIFFGYGTNKITLTNWEDTTHNRIEVQADIYYASI